MISSQSVIYIRVIDSGNDNCIGYCVLGIADFLDQARTEKIVNLKAEVKNLKNNFSTAGTISGDPFEEKASPYQSSFIDSTSMILSLRIRFFWSKKNYFDSQIENTREILQKTENDLIYINKLSARLKSPFSLVIYGYLDEIKENELLDYPKAKEEILEKKRLTVLPKQYQKVGQATPCVKYGCKIDQQVSKSISKINIVK